MTARRWIAWGLFAVLDALSGVMVVRDAPGDRTATAVVVLVASVAAIAFGLVRGLRYRVPDAKPSVGGRESSVGLAATERAVYSRWVANPVLALVGVGVAAAMFASGTLLPVIGGVAWLYLVAGVASLRVHIDERGVKVAAWPLGRPKRSVPIDRVRRACVVEVGRCWWWGLCWLPRRRSWAFRVAGRHALEVALDSGESLLVTVPDAAVAAGLLNDLVDRLGPLV